jgi:hypothetical protein
MNSTATLALVRAMQEERRRPVRPSRIAEPNPDAETPMPHARSWAVILGFQRLQPSKG